MPDDEVAALTETLATHREMLTGAIRTYPELDLQRALEVHAGLGDLMTRWTHFTADQQRETASARRPGHRLAWSIVQTP